MSDTHPTRGVSTILVLSGLSFGLLTGAMLLIGVSIVGFWKSLTPPDFIAWFAEHSGRLGIIMIPLGTITLLVSLAALAISWHSPAKQRQRALIAALCAVGIMVTYPVFFAGANASFIDGALSDSAVRALLDKWAVWHWGRTLLGLAGFLAAILALQLRATEHPHWSPTIYKEKGGGTKEKKDDNHPPKADGCLQHVHQRSLHFLMFLSTMFYPLAQLPGWFHLAARINPMTWQVDLLRFSLLGTGAPAIMLLEAVAFGVFTLVCLALAVRALDDAA